MNMFHGIEIWTLVTHLSCAGIDSELFSKVIYKSLSLVYNMMPVT